MSVLFLVSEIIANDHIRYGDLEQRSWRDYRKSKLGYPEHLTSICHPAIMVELAVYPASLGIRNTGSPYFLFGDVTF